MNFYKTTQSTMMLFMNYFKHYPILSDSDEKKLLEEIQSLKQAFIETLVRMTIFPAYLREQKMAYEQDTITQCPVSWTEEKTKQELLDTLDSLSALCEKYQKGDIPEDRFSEELSDVAWNWQVFINANVVEALRTQIAFVGTKELDNLTTLRQLTELASRYHALIEKIHTFELHNLRLIVNFAKGIKRNHPFEDRVQHGFIGLRIAVLRFDPSKGYKFSTYASHWIKQAIHRALETTGRAIRLPVHIEQQLNDLHGLQEERLSEFSDEEAMKLLKVTEEQLARLYEYQKAAKSLSLDQDISTMENRENTLLDILTQDTDNQEEVVAQKDFIQKVLDTIASIFDKDPRSFAILQMRFLEEKTLADVGRAYNISRERVRQIEEAALAIIKDHPLLKKLLTD